MSASIVVDTGDLTKLIDAFRVIPDKTAEGVRLCLKKGARDIREHAVKHHRFKSRTAKLERAIKSDVDDAAMVGRVFIDDKAAPYGKFVHEGTRSHPIQPRKRKMLRWAISGGGFAFAKHVMHPGATPDQFLYQAAETLRPGIVNSFRNTAVRLMREAIR